MNREEYYLLMEAKTPGEAVEDLAGRIFARVKKTPRTSRPPTSEARGAEAAHRLGTKGPSASRIAAQGKELGIPAAAVPAANLATNIKRRHNIKVLKFHDPTYASGRPMKVLKRVLPKTTKRVLRKPVKGVQDTIKKGKDAANKVIDTGKKVVGVVTDASKAVGRATKKAGKWAKSHAPHIIGTAAAGLAAYAGRHHIAGLFRRTPGAAAEAVNAAGHVTSTGHTSPHEYISHIYDKHKDLVHLTAAGAGVGYLAGKMGNNNRRRDR